MESFTTSSDDQSTIAEAVNRWFNSSNDTADVETTVAGTTEFLEHRIEKVIWTYGSPIIVTVGTVGNVLSLVVLLRSRMRSTSVYFYLAVLSCADTMVLYVSAFKTWIRVITGFELLTACNFCCKLIFFLTLVSFHLAAWLVVLVTLDRFIVVWFPLKATTMCVLSRARLGTAVLVGVIVLSYLHVFWTFALKVTRDGASKCYPVKEHGAFTSLPFHILKLVTYSILPFLTILVLNVAIIVRLRRAPLDLQGQEMYRHHHQHQTQYHHDEQCRAPAETAASNCCPPHPAEKGSAKGRSVATTKTHFRLTYMLLTISISWLLLTAPWTIETLVNQWSSPDPLIRARENLGKTVCFMLYYVNHSVNFFLYCVTGNKFRRELRSLFAQIVSRVRRPWPAANSPSSGAAARTTVRSNCIEMDGAGGAAGAGAAGAGAPETCVKVAPSKTSRSDSRL